MRKFVVAMSALAVVLLVALLITWKQFTGFLVRPTSVQETTVSIVLDPQLSNTELDELLHEKGLLGRRGWFGAYLDYFRDSFSIQPGEYKFTASMSPQQIADQITRGRVVTYPVIVKAGWSAEQTAEHLEKLDLVAKDKFLAMVHSATLAAELEIDAPTLDGYLYPDAYELPRDFNAQALVERMVRRFKSHMQQNLRDAAKEKGLTEHQLIILASLLELVPHAEERAMFSAVYHARLKSDMPLSSRAALAFGIKKRPERLNKADFEKGTIYNTFLYTGLPPKPLVSPSLKSIGHAAFPAKSDVLYAAPLGNRRHRFCVDRDCYNAVVARAVREGELVDPR